MSMPRIFLAAIAATLLSSASFAAPPTADQVAVPQGAQMRHHGDKMNALFSSPEERMMFKMEMRQATRGMDHGQKKAYRKAQLQKIAGMPNSERQAWSQDLQAKWNALPVEKRTKLAQKMEKHAAKHGARAQDKGQGYDDQDMSGPPPQQ
jgi:hypothetical protein